jgi:hypothetical protein
VKSTRISGGQATNGDVRGLTLHITPITLPRLHGPLGMVSSIHRQVLFALCADTLVALYFGWQSTIALAQTSTPDTLVAVYFGWRGTIGLAQTGTPDSMVPFADFAFWPPLFFSI